MLGYAGAPLLTVQLCAAMPPAAPPSELRLWLPPDAMHAARLAAADLVAVNPVAETPAPAALPAPPADPCCFRPLALRETGPHSLGRRRRWAWLRPARSATGRAPARARCCPASPGAPGRRRRSGRAWRRCAARRGWRPSRRRQARGQGRRTVRTRRAAPRPARQAAGPGRGARAAARCSHAPGRCRACRAAARSRRPSSRPRWAARRRARPWRCTLAPPRRPAPAPAAGIGRPHASACAWCWTRQRARPPCCHRSRVREGLRVPHPTLAAPPRGPRRPRRVLRGRSRRRPRRRWRRPLRSGCCGSWATAAAAAGVRRSCWSCWPRGTSAGAQAAAPLQAWVLPAARAALHALSFLDWH